MFDFHVMPILFLKHKLDRLKHVIIFESDQQFSSACVGEWLIIFCGLTILHNINMGY